MPDLSTEGSELLRGSGGEPASGPGGDQGGESPGVLARAVALRFPDLSELSPSARVYALADYIAQTAIMRGELEELRLEAHVALRESRERLRRIPATVHKSRAAAEESRRAQSPELAREIDHWQWIVDRGTEQIARFGGTEYDAASRTYTLLSGS